MVDRLSAGNAALVPQEVAVELVLEVPGSASRGAAADTHTPDRPCGRADDRLTRPSLRLGKQLSLRKRRVKPQGQGPTAVDGPAPGPGEERETSFQRSGVTYRSLPPQRRSGGGTRVRRASSLTQGDGNWEEVTVTFGLIRQSSRRLEDRIARHRQTLAHRPQYTRRNLWQHFKDVQWPKLRSRLRVLFGYELWSGHMKEVEGNFGTAVVSYFLFLRWLFLLNLLIFTLWFGLVVIPQLVWVAGTDAPRTPSQLSCVFSVFSPNSTGPPRACPDSFPPLNMNSTNPRLLCEGGEVEEEEVRFKVGECEFDLENGTSVARREHPDDTVSVASCNLTSGDVTYYYQCPYGIDPVTPWYQYIFDFVLGKGIFNDTVLFHGRYTNETVETVAHVSYNLPLAYLLLTGAIYLMCLVLLVYKMGHAYNESYIEFGRRRRINYCNKLFSSWEFSVTDENTASLKRAQIRREFEEEIADLDKRSQQRDLREWALVVLSRLLANLFVLLILSATAVAIFYAAQLGLDSQLSGDTSSLQLEGLVLPVTISSFNICLPILFSFLARFERFKTQSGEIRMTLIRAIFVRLSSLAVLLITLLILISCTQSFSDDSNRDGGQEEGEGDSEDVCQFSVPDVSISTFLDDVGNTTSQILENRENCPLCWETFVGQELYKLGLINFVLSALTTITVETTRNLLSRLKWKVFNEKLGKGDFNIAKSILDLIYTQTLLWLGFFYSPFLPFVVLVTSFVLFYVKKYSLIWNLVPSKRGAYKATKSNFLFLFLMLAVLLTSLVPIGYSVARLHPSQNCGPFRGKELIYDVVTDVIERADCRLQQVLDYVQSTGFLLPVIIVLLLLCYAQMVVLRARKRKFRLLKKQLLLEAADSTFYGQQLLLAGRGRERSRGRESSAEEEVDGRGGAVGGVVPLQQRLEARRSLTEEQRETLQRSKRQSGQVAYPAITEDST